MEAEAREIESWGKNVYVKIPIMNTKKESTIPLIKKLSESNIQLNITAIMTLGQVKDRGCLKMNCTPKSGQNKKKTVKNEPKGSFSIHNMV